MRYINISNLKKYYGDYELFSIDKFELFSGDKVGIVGQNGSGKSTLLKIIYEIEEYDTGKVDVNALISYLPQYSELTIANSPALESASAGEIQKLRIKRTLEQPHDLLLLDEPTSNLDLDYINFLKERLKKESSFILISHNRDLLNTLCTSILEIENKKVKLYKCTYDEYTRIKEEEVKRQKFEYEEYLAKKEKLYQALKEQKEKEMKFSRKNRKISNSDRKAQEFSSVGRSYSAKQKALAKKAKSIQSRIDQLPVVERPYEAFQIKPWLQLYSLIRSRNKYIIYSDCLNFSYDDGKIIFENAKFYIENGSKTVIVGKNGCGKTTLLNLIADRKSEVGIYISPQVKIGMQSQNLKELDYNKTVGRYILENSIQGESFSRSILYRMGFPADKLQNKINTLSGGEQVKLSLVRLFLSDFNVLIFDEVTNYLDITSITALEELIKMYPGTIICVSHDVRFIKNISTNILRIKDGKIFQDTL